MSEAEKTLGQVAQEAYVASLNGGVSWGDLNDEMRTAWETAVKAVVAHGTDAMKMKLRAGASALRARALVVLYQAAIEDPTRPKPTMEACYAAKTLLEQSETTLQHIIWKNDANAQLQAWVAPPEAQ